MLTLASFHVMDMAIFSLDVAVTRRMALLEIIAQAADEIAAIDRRLQAEEHAL